MTKNTVSTVANIIPALNTLANGAQRTARRGKLLRVYTNIESNSYSKEFHAAFAALLRASKSVRVYHGTSIYTLTLDGNTVVWSERATATNREKAVIELAL